MDELKTDVGSAAAQKILESIKETNSLDILSELIKDNTIPFEFNGIKYRIRLLETLKEKEELADARLKQYVKLMTNESIYMEEDLIKLYEKKGIYIKDLDAEINKLNEEELMKMRKTGKIVADKEFDSIKEECKAEILNLREQKRVLIIRRSILLEFSLENQLTTQVAKYLAYLSLEKKDGENWVKVFNSFEEFRTTKEGSLIEQAVALSMILQNA